MEKAQVELLERSLDKIERGVALNLTEINSLKSGLSTMEQRMDKQETDFDRYSTASEKLWREFQNDKRKLLGHQGKRAQRKPGAVSEGCALALVAELGVHLEQRGKMREWCPDSRVRDIIQAEARNIFGGVERSFGGAVERSALTTSDIALPTEYVNELKELQAEYGVCRREMSYYPIGRGTSKPARLGTQNDFTFPIAMSAALTEKQLQLGTASLESHKGGGILRLPREIDEQGIIPLGQMLARYAARKFAKQEDTIGFLGDGTSTYDNISGICKIANGSSNEVVLGATKTAPSDATITDWREMRSKVASPVISSGKYYAHPTWEMRFRNYKTQADPDTYIQNGPRGMATLDGYDIVWTEVLQPYSATAAASKYIGVFGDLQFWWFGEHGHARTDFSSDVYFSTDEIAVRWLEEIDFDYADTECAAVLRLAAG